MAAAGASIKPSTSNGRLPQKEHFKPAVSGVVVRQRLFDGDIGVDPALADAGIIALDDLLRLLDGFRIRNGERDPFLVATEHQRAGLRPSPTAIASRGTRAIIASSVNSEPAWQYGISSTNAYDTTRAASITGGGGLRRSLLMPVSMGTLSKIGTSEASIRSAD